MEISPALHEIIVAVSRKAVDERMEEFAVTRRDFDEVRVAIRDLATAQTRTEQRLQELATAQARTEQRLEELATAQARTEQRLEELATAQARTEQRLKELATAQARTEQRLEELATAQARTEQRLEELATAQARTEQRLEELATAQARTEQRLEELATALQDLATVQKEVAAILERFDTRISDLKGWQLELRYQERAVAYFGPLLRRMRVVFPNEMEDELEAHLSTNEFQDLLQLDLLVSGQPRHRPDAPQVWLAVEVSAVVDRHDVERARRRAATLRRAGYRAIPTVAGEQVTAVAEEETRIHKTLLLRNGKALFWEDALEEALSAG